MGSDLQKLRLSLGGVETPCMGGDNLAVCLASLFEPGIESDELDDSGTWKQGAIDAMDQVLDAVHAHYAARIAELEAALSAATAAREAAEAEAARLREAFREQRLKPGVRAVITAVHKRATEMGDQKCKAWLNSLGFELGLQLSRDRMDLAEAVEGSFTRAALGGEHG